MVARPEQDGLATLYEYPLRLGGCYCELLDRNLQQACLMILQLTSRFSSTQSQGDMEHEGSSNGSREFKCE